MIDLETELLGFICAGTLRQFSIDTPFDEVARIMGETTHSPNFPEYRFDDNFEVYSENNRVIRIRFMFPALAQGMLYADWYNTLSCKSLAFVSKLLQTRRIAHTIHTFSDLTTAIVIHGCTSYFTFDETGEIHMVQFDRRGFVPLIRPIGSRIVK